MAADTTGAIVPPPPPNARAAAIQQNDPTRSRSNQAASTQSGSTGQISLGSAQPLTPYGGPYPQPLVSGGISPQFGDDIASTTSKIIRPNELVRTLILNSGNTLIANTNWTSSNPLPFSYTIRDLIIFTTAVQFNSTVRFGYTRDRVTDGPSADGSIGLILPQSADNTGTTRRTIPVGFTVLPIYGLNAYVSDVNTRLWLEFFNNDSGARFLCINFTIEVEPGSETIP